jgi:putative transposase
MSNFLAYSFRIKDSSKSLRRSLREKAQAVNFVWNFCNETQLAALRKGKGPKDWPGQFELMRLTSGSTKELGLQSSTIQTVCDEYATRRKQFKKNRLNWRSKKKSLPWIPFKSSAISVDRVAGTARYYGVKFSFWNSREIQGQIKTGSICADNRGRWYLNLTCAVEEVAGPPRPGEVGIDLGLKSVVSLSTGESVSAPRIYRSYEEKLAKAQRAKKPKQVRNIHKKISNSRRDFNHKLSTKLVRDFGLIVVGDVSPSKLAKTTMAKSVYDVSWAQLKTFLSYKASARRSTYLEVGEKYSTQTCSECGCIPKSSPKGIKDLSVRGWICSDCGTEHNRDTNAARNILRFGHESLKKQGFDRDFASTGIPGL